MDYENYNELYEGIASILWKIMPENAKEYIFRCDIYNEVKSYQMYWKDKNGKRKDYPLGEFPVEDVNIINKYSKLKALMSEDGHGWTHSTFTLNNDGGFNIQFAYIEEDDSWNMLYMRGISDLREDELDEYYIPKEIWLNRLARKSEIYKVK